MPSTRLCTHLQALLELKQATHPELGPDIKTLKLTVETKVPDLLHVKITDAANKRWEVPEQLLAKSAEQIKGLRISTTCMSCSRHVSLACANSCTLRIQVMGRPQNALSRRGGFTFAARLSVRR